MVSKSIVTFVLVCVCLINHVFCGIIRTNFDEDLDLERGFKSSYVVKTIKFEGGDIIDCFLIHKQPSLEHPLLKNHKIQMRPQSYPIGMTKSASNVKYVSLRSYKQSCPIGTVPIYRTKKENLVKANLFSKLSTTYENDVGLHQVYITIKKDPKIKHLGASAFISNRNITVEQDQRSSTNIWIQNGDTYDHLNAITVGWMASPILFNDSVPRLFIFWMSDGIETGCFNMFCQGFIQLDPQVAPGYPIIQSTNDTTKGCEYLIYQDYPTKNWWLYIVMSDMTGKYSEKIKVGYWPKKVFSNLHQGASQVGWGAEVVPGKNGVSPPMGSGHLPFGDYKSDTFFSRIQHINEVHVSEGPTNVLEHVDRSRCYDLKVGKYEGYSFTYGGRGGYCES